MPSMAPAQVEDPLVAARMLFDAGRLDEAEQAYLALLGSHPKQDVVALQLGLIAHMRGDDGRAFELSKKAVQLNPQSAPARNNLGNALRGERCLDEALESYRMAIELDAGYAAPHFNVGTILAGRGVNEEAISCFESAVKLNPSFADAYNALGVALMETGRLEEAVESYRRALQLRPDFFEVHNNLAIALTDLKCTDEALGMCQRAFLLRPDSAELCNTEGRALSALGRFERALATFHQAISLKPDYAAPHNNLGIVLQKLRRYHEAIPHYRRAIELDPLHLEAHSNLGFALGMVGELTESVASSAWALELRPDYVHAHYSMGLALVAQGRVSEALASFERACRGNTKYTGAHSNLLFTMNYLYEQTQEEIYRASLLWDQEHCGSARSRQRPHKNERSPERRLRIGFVSPDFHNHSVSFFFLPFLDQSRRLGTGMEYFCYADVTKPDAITKRLQRLADGWVDIVGMTDEAVAQRVRDDGIDVLFDLAAHTGLRLLVFAEKPAPVQVTWLGYPNTTGLAAMDYRLTDAIADPEGEADLCHSERLYRLPDGFLCYSPHEEAPKVAPLPALTNGFVTFGSFNNFAKVSPEVIRLWARLLGQLPGARLILKGRSFTDLPTKRYCESAFASYGIDPGRLDLRPWEDADQSHLSAYGRIDIALDTFPYNGTTTTCEALWMGVPVVTLLGDRHAARVGASILSRVGLGTLIAKDHEEYLSLACDLAADLERLSSLRGTLRGTMAGSPLCDARSFAENMETACRKMWRGWCREADESL